MPNHNYIEELEFDLPARLLEELVTLFGEMPSGPLTPTALNSVGDDQGVYQLFKDDELVYIGKTDSEAGLKNRLARHSIKIQSRLNLNVSQVTFKAIRVFVFTAMDLESLLIKHYTAERGRPEWQLSGFGSNDPGRERDTSKAGPFDAMYPIDLDVTVTIEAPEQELSVAFLLSQMKRQLSYNIRFQRSGKKVHPDLQNTTVEIDAKSSSVRDLLKLVKASLGSEWQITALPGYIIIYKESRNYPSGEVIQED